MPEPVPVPLPLPEPVPVPVPVPEPVFPSEPFEPVRLFEQPASKANETEETQIKSVKRSKLSIQGASFSQRLAIIQPKYLFYLVTWVTTARLACSILLSLAAGFALRPQP